jgi:hypothetical protein
LTLHALKKLSHEIFLAHVQREQWMPSHEMVRFMKDLCNQLHLSYREQTAGISCQEQYSAKLAALQNQRDAQRHATADKVSNLDRLEQQRSSCSCCAFRSLSRAVVYFIQRKI